MNRQFLLSLLFLICSSTIGAKIQLPAIFSVGMILQQSTNVKIWGKANKNTDVEIRCSWNDTPFRTHSNAEGEWNTFISTPIAG